MEFGWLGDRLRHLQRPAWAMHRPDTALAWLATGASEAIGPQGPTIFTDLSGTLRIGFSGWAGTPGYPGGVRAFWTGPLGFADKKPTL
jgi:hypothetical protein